MSAYQVSLDLAPVIIPGHTWQEKPYIVCPGLDPLVTPALELKKGGKAHKVSSDLSPITSPQALSGRKRVRRVTFDLNPIIIPAPKLDTKAKTVSFDLFPEIIPLYRRGEVTLKGSFNLTPTIINSQSILGRNRARRAAFISTRTKIAPRTSQSTKTKFCEVCFKPIITSIPHNCQPGKISTPRGSLNPYEAKLRQVTSNLTTPITPLQSFAGMDTFLDLNHPMPNSRHGYDYDADHDSESTVWGSDDYPTLQRGFNDTPYAKGTRGYEDVVEIRQLRYLRLLRDCREHRERRRLRKAAIVAAYEQHVEYEDPGELGDIENMPGGKGSYKRRIMRGYESENLMEEMEESKEMEMEEMQRMRRARGSYKSRAPRW